MNDQRIRGDTLSSFLSLSLSECLRPSLTEPTKWAAANKDDVNMETRLPYALHINAFIYLEVLALFSIRIYKYPSALALAFWLTSLFMIIMYMEWANWDKT